MRKVMDTAEELEWTSLGGRRPHGIDEHEARHEWTRATSSPFLRGHQQRASKAGAVSDGGCWYEECTVRMTSPGIQSAQLCGGFPRRPGTLAQTKRASSAASLSKVKIETVEDITKKLFAAKLAGKDRPQRDGARGQAGTETSVRGATARKGAQTTSRNLSCWAGKTFFFTREEDSLKSKTAFRKALHGSSSLNEKPLVMIESDPGDFGHIPRAGCRHAAGGTANSIPFPSIVIGRPEQ